MRHLLLALATFLALASLAACGQANPEAAAALAEKTAHAARHTQIDSVAKAYLAAVDPKTAGSIYASDAMIFSPDVPKGDKATVVLAKMAESMQAMSAMKMESNVTAIGDDFFAIAGNMSAVYSGPANPMDPKSPKLKDVAVGGPWVALVKVNAEGKITEERIMWDNMAMAMQLEAAAKKK